MPIYEYLCDACGHELEALQKLADSPLTDCPECAAMALRKKVSAAAFRLKGGGWYETDFKSGNKKNLAGEERPATKTDNSTGESAKKGADASKNAAKKNDKPSSSTASPQ